VRLDAADARVRLGTVLTQLGRYAEPEVLLVAAWESYAQAATVPLRSMGRVLSSLVELYDAWHTAEPEKGYNAKVAEWRAKAEQR
jgi:hypothetical protein